MNELSTYRASEVHHILEPIIGILRLEAQDGEVKGSTVDNLYQRFRRMETEAFDSRLQDIADAWNEFDPGTPMNIYDNRMAFRKVEDLLNGLLTQEYNHSHVYDGDSVFCSMCGKSRGALTQEDN